MKDELVRLALRIYDCGAFQDRSKSPEGKGFRLKLHEQNPEAPLSPFYLNLRTPDNPKPGPLTPDILDDIGRLMLDRADEEMLDYRCIAGVPNAGDPFADAFQRAARDDQRPVQVLRMGKATAGDKRRITGVKSGAFVPGERVLVIDDLITKADSKLKAIKTLEQDGLVIEAVMVLIDREQGGGQELVNVGYKFIALLPVSKLLDALVHYGHISTDMRGEITAYLNAA